MGGKTINTSDTKLEALNIQSSCYGGAIAWLRGMHRIPGNLVWYGDFKATSHTEQTGGKGGGGSSNTTFTYSASLAMGLCHGTVAAIPRVWKGKATSSLSALHLSLFGGAVGQAGWSVLNGRGLETLNYSGLCYVAGQAYDLGGSASVENHSFEVQHSSAYSIAGTPDVDPAAATYDLLTHPHQGANFPAARIADWSEWSNYCVANGILVSPLLTTQVAASDALQTMADLTNTAIVWSEGKLKMRPYGDQAVTGHGRTFTPDTTPVYELDDSCYIKPDNDVPLKRALKTEEDCFNICSLQYLDRANGYNPAVVQAKDLTDIAANGARPRNQIQADWICDGTVARLVAELRKQRDLLVLGTFTFRLSWHFALLEVMDLVTLTDTVLQLLDVPARVTEISEEGDEELAVTCEDYPAGVASAPLYAAQGMTGFAMNANVTPGDALAPVIFELPGALSTTGLEIGIAAAGTDANWGGCQVWVSYDGTTYQQLTELRQKSRYGSLTADGGTTLGVHTNAGQQLLSGSASDLAALSTLLYVTPLSGVGGEYLAYQTATLTGASAYTLSTLSRAAYGTTQGAHVVGTPFVRVDDAIGRSGPLDPALIGKTIHIKLLSFNVFGNAVQSLADVSATDYTITGAHFVSPSATLSIKTNYVDFNTPNYNECYVHGRDASGVAVDAPGVILVNGQAKHVPNTALYGNNGPYSGFIAWDMGGTVFTVLGIAGYPLAGVRRYGTQWQYDPNNGQQWVNFTPTDQVVCIGTIVSGGPDTGAPGAPPGITDAKMWAHASSLDSLVSSAALPSLKVQADNQNANDNGFAGHSVAFSTGFTAAAAGRGHTLVVYDPATDTAAAPALFDTYLGGAPLAALIAALAAVPVGRIVALFTYDASSHDAGLRTALLDFGGSATAATWSTTRTSHAFIGQRGLAAGQGYEAISSASDASGVVTLQAYYTVSSLVRNGTSGTDGTPGANGADGTSSYVHIKYSNDGGSSFTASAGETPGAYIGQYTDSTVADSTNVAEYTWALIKGADGINGTPGTPGSDGTPSYLHIKWSDDGGATFTASAGETPGRYIGTYTDSTLADSASVGAYTWALVKGADGSAGTDGEDAILMTLSPVSVTLRADSTGLVSDYSAAVTTAKVARGSGVTSDDTANWAFSRTNGSGVTSSISGATLTVTALAGDTGYVDITATRAGYADQVARFALTKARSATPASGPVSTAGYYEGYHVTTSPNDCSCYVEFRRDGTVYTGFNPSTNTHAGDWYLPNGTTVGDGYEIRFDQIATSGLSGGLIGGTVGAWVALSSSRGLTLATTENTNAVRTRKFTYAVRDASTKATVCTGTFNLDAEVEV